MNCTSSYKKKEKRRGIYRETSTTMFALSCCAFADCLALLATLAFCLCFRGIEIADVVNHVLVQPNEHHALNLTRKHAATQIADKVGERCKIALGLTATGLDPMIQPS